MKTTTTINNALTTLDVMKEDIILLSVRVMLRSGEEIKIDAENITSLSPEEKVVIFTTMLQKHPKEVIDVLARQGME